MISEDVLKVMNEITQYDIDAWFGLPEAQRGTLLFAALSPTVELVAALGLRQALLMAIHVTNLNGHTLSMRTLNRRFMRFSRAGAPSIRSVVGDLVADQQVVLQDSKGRAVLSSKANAEAREPMFEQVFGYVDDTEERFRLIAEAREKFLHNAQ